VTISLTADQEKTIQQAIESALVGSVDEFIESAFGTFAARQRRI
jgi:hypothetical protein